MPKRTHNDDWFWNKYDSNFDKAEKRFDRAFGIALVGIIIGWIVSIAILVGVVIVAIHFLAKVW